MSEAEQSPNTTRAAEADARVLCPYCGHTSSNRKECDRCRGVFEPLSRQASQNAMGPWFIRDESNPFRPGCSYATIKALVVRKRIDGDTVLRGPSTRQFWLRARNAPGVAHLLGECHACHKPASPSAAICTQCGASFVVEEDRQFLGLAEARALPGQAGSERAAGRAAAAVEEEAGIRPAGETPERVRTPAPEPIRQRPRSHCDATSLSDGEIEEMLKRGRAYDRANASTRVVTILVALAIVGVLAAGVFAVALFLQSQRTTAGAGGSPAGATAPTGVQ